MPRVTKSGLRTRDRGQVKSAKHAAWRRYRRFGQAPGGDAVGRSSLYIPWDRLPAKSGNGHSVLVENRPHRDHFFPVTGAEVMARMRQLPADHIEGITHVWLRRMGPTARRFRFGTYSCGPGYAAIVLYPWPRSLCWTVGPRKPSLFWRQVAEQFDGRLERRGGMWFAQFTEAGARRFFLDDLILHEVGHHNDWRRSSSANHKQTEEFARQYAAEWARRLAAQERTDPKLSKARMQQLRATLLAAHPYWTAEIYVGLNPRPRPDLDVSFRLLDRHGRMRSQRVWLRPDSIDGLTMLGLKRRIERANQPEGREAAAR